jgi:hypothetical protein
MINKLLTLIILLIASQAIQAQNGTRPDTEKVIVGSQVVRSIPVLNNDNLVAGKNYQLIGVFNSVTSPSNVAQLGMNGNLATYKELQSGSNPDTFFYIAKDLNSNTNDTNYVLITKDALNLDLYPGDANKDNICNHIDVLNIGIAYGKNQIIREGIFLNNDWAPVKAYDWTFSNLKSNYRYSDANGDGIVDSLGDVGTVVKNYNRFIGTTNISYSPTGGQAFQVIAPDTVLVNSPNSTFQLKINLGSSANKVANAYGLSFTIRCDTALTKPGKINFKASKWFNDQQSTLNFTKINYNTGELELTVVRKNGLNDNGSGEFGVVDVVVEDILDIIKSGFNSIFIIEKAVLIDSNYNLLPITLPVSKPVYLKKSTSQIQNTTTVKSLYYYINADNNLYLENKYTKTLEVQIFNILGKQIQQKQLSANQTIEINTSSWGQGIYFIKTQTEIYKLMIK